MNMHLRKLLIGLAFSVTAFCVLSAHARDRWTEEQANTWYAKQPWLVGSNYIPSTAINQLEMWQADTFDPKTIDRELGWAHDLGFTSIRVFLHDLLWNQDREGFLNRVDQFLAIADKHGIGVMIVPLDAVWDPQPKLGKQPAPKPHVHNSGWVQAPGADILKDPKRHDELKPYIQGLIKRFGQDRRVQVWDLFNEPDNPNRNSYGVEGSKTELDEKVKEDMATLLLPKLFAWAREMNPSQPLTAGIWRGDWSVHERMAPYNKIMVDESDVISYHCYDRPDDMKIRINQLRRYNRPILCTEYMARGNGSFFDPILGLLKSEKVAAYNWGFVDGKSQTIYPWDTWQKKYTDRPELWFHDIFTTDGKAYRQPEVDYIKSQTKK
jgi:Cellulase (glycosyl hydrolase family 5)